MLKIMIRCITKLLFSKWRWLYISFIAATTICMVQSRRKFNLQSNYSNDLSSTITMSFQILQYNIFGRPYEVSKDGQIERISRIPSSLFAISKDIDVITFAESDNTHERGIMLEKFKENGYLYSTTILHDPDPFESILNGGVLIVSKWPILKEAQHVYRFACHYADCLAAKGVKYARVLKTVNGQSKVFNVFATHMQAWSTPQGRSDRQKQARQMRVFVDAFNLPVHEPILFAGDFNVDNITFGHEVETLVELLGAHMPDRVGDQLFTSNPRTNVLVGRDGAAHSEKCYEQYLQSWGPRINATFHPTALTRVNCFGTELDIPMIPWVYVDSKLMCYCPCCPHEWLDYVLYARPPFQQPILSSDPVTPTLQAFDNKVQPFTVDWSAPQSNTFMDLVDLSDHYPVLGKFEFAITDTDKHVNSYHLDGCSSDSDCHLHAESMECFCSGKECYYNGKHFDGSHSPTNHPVNRMCLYQKTKFECLCGPT